MVKFHWFVNSKEDKKQRYRNYDMTIEISQVKKSAFRHRNTIETKHTSRDFIASSISFPRNIIATLISLWKINE